MRHVAVYDDAETWTAALQCYGHDFYHLADYALLCARHEGACAVAFEARVAHGRFFVPLLIKPVDAALQSRARHAHTPYGYSGPLVLADAREHISGVIIEGLQCLRETMREMDTVSVFIRWHPLLTPLPEIVPASVEFCICSEIVVVDLSRPDKQRWEQMRRNHRQNIKGLQRDGFHTIFDNSREAVATFSEMYRKTMWRVDASEFYHFDEAYISDLVSLSDGSPQICLVVKDHIAVSGGLFFECGDILTCHLSATDPHFLSSAPSKLMLWESSCWGRAMGKKIMNIGGGVGGRTETSLFHFKQGFSPERRNYHALGVVCDPMLYGELCRRAERLRTERPDESYFPAYHISSSRPEPSTV